MFVKASSPVSEYHMTEYFGPILGIMTADTLEEAIELQNAPDYGLTAGLHSLDAEELELWLSKVQAGNVYVNRGNYRRYRSAVSPSVAGRSPLLVLVPRQAVPATLLHLSDWEPHRGYRNRCSPSPLTVRESSGYQQITPICARAEDFAFLDRVRHPRMLRLGRASLAYGSRSLEAGRGA